MAYPLVAFIEPLGANISDPAKILHRDTITPAAPSSYELDQLHWGARLNGPATDPRFAQQSPTTPVTPRELEQSQPSTPSESVAVDALIQSATNPPRNKWRLLGAGCMFMMMGLSDAATGAVLPYMEEDYDIGYAKVSLIFVAQAAGFILAAPFCHAIDRKLGRSRSYIMVNTLTTIAYALVLAALPFPVVVVAFLLMGFALGLFLAMTNLFIVNLLNGTVILGFMHALYGLGGVLSPVIATTMISHGIKWSRFYCVTFALSVISLCLMGWAYRGFEEDASVQLLTALEQTASRQASALGEPSARQLLKRALKTRTTLLGALFILFYQGAEVSISGWVISFLINYRKGNPAAVGNVTSGFWGGITVGRLILTPLCSKLGEKRCVFVLTAVAAAFQLLVWLVPNIIGVAVAESLVGLALGPIYPCATAVFAKLLPRSIQVSAVSFVTAMGSSGGAIIPLVTGLMAQRLGTVVLHPIVLCACVVMEFAWLFLPRINKRRE